MNWLDYVITYVFLVITTLISTMCYGRINNNQKDVFKFKNIVSLLFIVTLIFINNTVNDSYFRALVSYLFIMMNYSFTYREDFNTTFIKGTFCYFMTLLFEIVLSVILIPTDIISLDNIDKSIIIKGFFSLGTVLIPYLILCVKKIRKFVNKVIVALDRPVITKIVMISSLMVIATLAYKFVSGFSTKVYIDNIILIIFFVCLISLIIYNRFVINKEIKKTEDLLDLITKYEKKNDEYREYKHELLNNLLALKSIENKNSKEFNDSLDELIELYNKKSSGVKNIHKLPSGLKGIVYYKLSDIESDKYNVNVRISKQLKINLDRISHKEYMSLCKIMGIVLDNAIEAMKNSKEKILMIDAYKEKDKVVIEINNTFDKSKTDITKIYNKNYSTKGKNRGLGLYLAKMLLKSCKHISMEQEILDGVFSTRIYINNK